MYEEDHKDYDNYNDYETLIGKILDNVNNSDLYKLEKVIYKDYDDAKKIRVEYNRIKSYLEKHQEDKIRYQEELEELNSNYEAYMQLKNDLSLSVARTKIVAFDILFDINVGLYKSLDDGYEYYLNNLKKYKRTDKEESLIWKKKS